MAIGADPREPKSIRWPLPIRGMWQGIDDANIPANALYSASNAIIRAGGLQGRPGPTPLTAQIFDTRPTGASHFVTTAQADRIVLTTLGKVWTYDFTTWTDRTGTLAGTADKPARIATLVFGTPPVTNAYICNDVDTLRTWKDGDATISAVTGSPPTFKDLTSQADRLIGLVGAHEVRWGEILTDNTWPTLNARFLSETPAATVAIRTIGTLGIVVYKRDSIWIGEATGATGGQAFCFTPVGKLVGPAGPAAVVDADGVHFYMTQTGRVAMFTGVSHEWIADGVWSFIKAEIDESSAARITGTYFSRWGEVWFWYPRTGDAGENLGVLIISLPKPKLNLSFFSCWPGVSGKSITAAINIAKLGTTTPIVFDSTNLKGHTLDGTNDNGVVISGHFQYGLAPPNDIEPARVLNVEPFFERLAGYGNATLKIASSNVLNTLSGTLSSGKTVDLTATPVKDYIGFDVRGRFIALRCEFTSAATIRYRGAVLRSKG